MTRATVVLAGALLAASPAAQAVRFPTNPVVYFQTSGCQRAAAVGDWYTSRDTASAARYGEFFLEVTPAMVPATIVILDADSNGTLDEVLNANDPTRFELRTADGSTVIQAWDVNSASDGIDISFPALGEGLYRIRSYTGTDQTAPAGGYCDDAAGSNDDDNGFRIQVNGASAIDGLLGFLQTTYQHAAGVATDYAMHFIVGPATSATTLHLRNFDLDSGASAVTYTTPGGTATAGTVSDNGVWNGVGGSLNAGQDSVVVNNDLAGGAVEAGVWSYGVQGWTDSNQTLFEANQNGQHLALTDTPPTRAGYFTISASGSRATTIGSPVDHPFTVTNLFFASDLVNFTTSGTAAGYTAELRSDPDCNGDASDGAPLVDSDGDGRPNSGVLAIAGTTGAALCFALRVTPGPSATGSDTTTVAAVSFLDARVGATNTTRSIARTTNLLPSVTLAKSVTVVSDPVRGTSAPTRIPGAVLEYAIVVTNPGVVADGLVVSDVLPAATTYVAGSLTVAGVAEDDDASGADETDPAGGDFGISAMGAVTARLPTLAAGTSVTITFRVTLD